MNKDRRNETAFIVFALIWALGLLWLIYVAEYVDK